MAMLYQGTKFVNFSVAFRESSHITPIQKFRKPLWIRRQGGSWLWTTQITKLINACGHPVMDVGENGDKTRQLDNNHRQTVVCNNY